MAVIDISLNKDCVSCNDSSVAGISLDFSGLFILLIVLSSLFVIKNLYDLMDFKIHEAYYTTYRSRMRKKHKS